MDASQYLRKQGWRGQGHSLDHSDRGIKKPLLISKKVDALGVGLNKHAAVSDQWWLRAFDNGLKNFGTGSTSKLSQVQKFGHRRSGLYDRFVRGAPIPGSIGKPVLSAAGNTSSASQTKENGAIVSQSGQSKEQPPPRTAIGTSSAIMETEAKSEKKRKFTGRDEGKQSRRKIDSASTARDDGRTLDEESSGLSETKLGKYARRAAEMGISVEEYIVRHQKKKEARTAADARDGSKIPSERRVATALEMTGEGRLTLKFPTQDKGNIVSTAGTKDSASLVESMGKAVAKIKPIDVEIASDTPFESKDYPGATAFADQAIRAISDNRTITIKTDDKREPFTWQANAPIPLDTRIWEGAKVNMLPKVIRRARRTWMKNRRDARKSDKKGGAPRGQRRADRKHQEHESLAIDILKQSRQLKTSDHAIENGVMSVKGFDSVPVVKVAGASGTFSNEEMANARAVARRMIRHTKKEKKREAKEEKRRESGKSSHGGGSSRRTSLSRVSKYEKRAKAR